MTEGQNIVLAAEAENEGRSRQSILQQFGVTSAQLDVYYAYWASEEGLDRQQEKYDR